MNEKANKKYFLWREEVKNGKDQVVFVAKRKEIWYYLYKGYAVPVKAMKVLLDKGNGFEEYTSFNETADGNTRDFSLLIKDFEKIILKDSEEKLYSFGLKDVKPDIKSFFAYIKVENFCTLIFADAEKNSVNIFEKCLNLSEDAVTSCIFDGLSQQASNFDSREGELDELFSR